MSRLRHHKLRPHSGASRHLNPPFGVKRRHGGRLHFRSEGEDHERKDRPKKRQVGGSAGTSTSSMTPAQLQMLQMQNAINQSGTANSSMPYNPTAVRKGGKVEKKRARGGSTDEDCEGMKSGGGKWIKNAIKRPGALHRALHVPEGEKIPAKKMAKAARSENPRIRKMVGLAKTLSKMHH